MGVDFPSPTAMTLCWRRLARSSLRLSCAWFVGNTTCGITFFGMYSAARGRTSLIGNAILIRSAAFDGSGCPPRSKSANQQSAGGPGRTSTTALPTHSSGPSGFCRCTVTNRMAAVVVCTSSAVWKSSGGGGAWAKMKPSAHFGRSLRCTVRVRACGLSSTARESGSSPPPTSPYDP
eukprot:1541293-Rhodomonas_salina.2